MKVGNNQLSEGGGGLLHITHLRAVRKAQIKITNDMKRLQSDVSTCLSMSTQLLQLNVELKKGLEVMNVETKESMSGFRKELRKKTNPSPECLICYEEMTPATIVIMCPKGHKVCQSCSFREIELGRGCPGHCGEGFLGRDFGMEHFLASISDTEVFFWTNTFVTISSF